MENLLSIAIILAIAKAVLVLLPARVPTNGLELIAVRASKKTALPRVDIQSER